MSKSAKVVLVEAPAEYAEFPQVHDSDAACGGRAISEIRVLLCVTPTFAEAAPCCDV